jgi:hypothetical protein
VADFNGWYINQKTAVGPQGAESKKQAYLAGEKTGFLLL